MNSDIVVDKGIQIEGLRIVLSYRRFRGKTVV